MCVCVVCTVVPHRPANVNGKLASSLIPVEMEEIQMLTRDWLNLLNNNVTLLRSPRGVERARFDRNAFVARAVTRPRRAKTQ